MPPPHHNRRQEQLVSAAHPRPEAPPRAGGAGDLGPAKAESSARGRAGSQLAHVPSAPPPQSLYAKRDRRRPHTVYKSGKQQARAPARQPSLAPPPPRIHGAGSEERVPATPAPHTRINKQILCHSVEAAAMGNPGPMLSNNFLVVPQLDIDWWTELLCIAYR